MFDIFFGWRKASKCKNLIKRVQCRLKLLKNKRSCIIRQLRDDLSDLLRNGHYQIVTERLFMDEKMVAVYDLLENYCEFIIHNLPYIRRHKDCPNDINEAVSSLIFASARLGELPELVMIRKLFRERYGQNFETCALQLLPGNLVSLQVKDNLCTNCVSDEEKYRLVDEIARICFQQGPLLLEYRHDELVNETSNAAADYNDNITKTEAYIVNADYSSKSNNVIEDPSISRQERIPTATSTCLSTTNKDSVHYLKNNGNERVQDSAQPGYLSQSTISSPERVTRRDIGKISGFTLNKNIERRDSAESQQMIYLDDIQEFESVVSKDVRFQDQRLFMFKAPIAPLSLKIDTGSNFEAQIAKERPRSSRKNNKISGKRIRRRSLSIEKSFVSDTDSTIYYGDLSESSRDSTPKRQNRRRNSRKSSVEESQKSNYTFAHDNQDQPCYVKFRSLLTFVKRSDDHSRSTCNLRCNGPMENRCSLEHPSYYWITNVKDSGGSPFRVPRRRVEAAKNFSKHSLKERKQGFYQCQCSCSQDQHIVGDGLALPPQIAKTSQDVGLMRDEFVKPDTEEVWESRETCSSIMSSTSRMADQCARKENQNPYLRATTMPPERPKDSIIDNFIRSNSFPVQEPGNGLSENSHVHPKLPDYDEIAVKFMALKKEKLQNKC
ncbi:PREDICTED: uncharacterized protein LOC109229556 isoform X2 [Nicotiana attenuata]|uniref:uncharacterized protein LOC109229556 isoform X2 n=1 Tax=Nicotiana attenuata TaxID=49451 RepID=UPI000904C994|nr:PREDICTED: uncharacterized protein LOC109229556 isoform X2 [Nicotiana attenuata]